MSDNKFKPTGSKTPSGKGQPAGTPSGQAKGETRTGPGPWSGLIKGETGRLFKWLGDFLRAEFRSHHPGPPLFRKVDWLCFGLTTLLVFIGYMLTLAPDLTLEDSGELAVGSFYAGVPHPPGYPVWTIYTWLFTLLPIGNIAYRVGISSAVAGALACGLVALMVSRGSSMMIEGIGLLKDIERRLENAICVVSGFVASMLIGFNGFMWSQAVIVEVYTLSVLSLAGVLVCLLRWIYAPQQRHYLYLAFFLFGITFNNHQSLLVIALGLEIAVLAVQPSLGRDLFFWNTIVYLGGWVGMEMGIVTTLMDNTPLQVIYHMIGLASAGGWIYLSIHTRKTGMELARDAALVATLAYLAVLFGAITHYVTFFQFKPGPFILFNLLGLGCVSIFIYLLLQTTQFGREWLSTLVCGGAWALGAAFYVYMPLASMTNPPLNWGYPRTVAGFFHAFTRGQYEKIHPTTGVGETPFAVLFSFIERVFQQIAMYIGGAMEEFSLVYILIGLLPFLFFRYLQKRERSWLIGLLGTYITLSLFLLILLNPAPDRQSRDLNRVFFTASHVIIAMGVGYGLTLVAAVLATQYQRWRKWALGASAAVAGLALFIVTVVFQESDNPFNLQGLMFDLAPSHEFFERFTAVYGLTLALFAVGIFLVHRQRLSMAILLGLFALLPIRSILAHWYNNEQRNHLFGFWFGHDMFTPPFGIYPEMARDTILFGGTDPGRFNPTYMIFCESFIPPSKKRDPNFDRRDVYIITQNALADGTYLSYIRAHYNRSTQIDPPFFQELLRGPQEREQDYSTNIIARAMIPIDKLFTGLGARIEKRRRAEGVYPPKEIHTPSNEESQRCFQEYLADAQRRLEHDRRFPTEAPQIRPGEDVRIIENRVQVSGQVAVMAINGLLTKVIFEANPDHEFYVEESFPLDWMYPYLTPFGIIMKLNRQPVAEITEEMVGKDHEFWTKYSERLIGTWINYETTVSNICAFAAQTYYRRDNKNYVGDPKFLRDSDAQKAFSKLRSSIAGVYSWRIGHITSQVQAIQRRPPAEQVNLQAELQRLSLEQQRMIKEAEFAFKQAYAFCPYSPEAIFRYINLLVGLQRLDEALLIATTSQKLDPFNSQLDGLLRNLEAMKQDQQARLHAAQNAPPGPAQIQAQIGQLQEFFRANPTNAAVAVQAIQLTDALMGMPQADGNTFLFAAKAYSDFGQYPKVENALERYLRLSPDSPEAWFDLAAMQTLLNKRTQAFTSLRESLARNARRLTSNPQAVNLYSNALTDSRLNSLRPEPEFQKILTDLIPKRE